MQAKVENPAASAAGPTLQHVPVGEAVTVLMIDITTLAQPSFSGRMTA